MSWALAAYGLLGLALAVGFAWYERSRPDARIVALVGTLAAFAALGRIAFAAVPNVKPTSDIVLIAGFTLGAGPGFAVGAVAGLTSNFFFGQGPWTPWQMAAWGATGVLGALLARVCSAGSGRSVSPGESSESRGADGPRRRRGGAARIGRWPLALVCAVAGFAFTAVQDAGDWVTYSDHSIGALGAYIASGLGFDALYAVACFGFALAFGPALLRSLQRFARRVEVSWTPLAGDAASRVLPLLLIGVLAAGAATELGPGADRARAATLTPLAQRAATYLEHAQNSDGGLGAASGQPSAELFAGWAALGLASAGVDVGTLRHGGGPTLLAYLRRGESAHDPGSLERTILALRAAGVSASTPQNLVALLARDVAPAGSVSGEVNLTAFAVLALRGAGSTATAPLERRAVRWLAGEADRDGGYAFSGRGSSSDADDTGAVLEAFGASRAPGVARARRRAIGFLRRDENSDGGFPDAPGAGSNAQSTAWAIQGLLAAGVRPDSLRRGGHTPLGYLSALVSGNGAVRYARGETQTPVWVTGEALMALTGTPLPIVGHSSPASAPPRPAGRTTSTGRGTGTGTTATTAAASPHTSAVARAGRPRRRALARRHPAVHRVARQRRSRRSARPAATVAHVTVARAVARMQRMVGALPRRVLTAMSLGL